MSKNGFVLKKNPMDCFKNWHAILIWHGIDAFTDHFFILFVWRLFFTIFHFFKVLKKEFFRISSNWVLFTASVTKTILSRFKNSGLDFSWFWITFFVFLKKKPFSHFWLNFLMEKNLKNSERLKMVFDGWFELSIVNLVGIEYLKVKIG